MGSQFHRFLYLSQALIGSTKQRLVLVLTILIFSLSGCKEVNIKSEMNAIERLELFVENEQVTWAQYTSSAPTEGLDSLQKLVLNLPDTSEVEDDLTKARILFWKSASIRWESHGEAIYAIGDELEKSEARIKKLKADRKTRSIKKERFFVYLQDEREQVQTLSRNMEIHKTVIEEVKTYFRSKGNQLLALQNESNGQN